MKPTSRRFRREHTNNSRTASTESRNRKFTFDENVIYEEDDEEQRHESEEVMRNNQSNNWIEEGSMDDMNNLILHSMRTASDSNDYDGDLREGEGEFLSEEGSYNDGSQVFEADEYYYEEGENSAGSYEVDDNNGEENDIYEYNEYGDINNNGGMMGGRPNPDLQLEVDSFCASTITSRWSPTNSPSSRQHHKFYDKERASSNSTSYYDSPMINNNPRMMASPVSVPDPGLDRYYIENASTASSALLHKKRLEKEKRGMGEYNWYPIEEEKFKDRMPSPTASTTRWKKNLAVHIDSHDTQLSQFNGLQKKVATSIVAYSPSPTSRGGNNDSCSESSPCDEFGIEVVQLSVSNSSNDIKPKKKQYATMSSETKRGSTTISSSDESPQKKQHSTDKEIRAMNDIRRNLFEVDMPANVEDNGDEIDEMFVPTPRITANLSKSNSTLGENQGKESEETVQTRLKGKPQASADLVNKYRNKHMSTSPPKDEAESDHVMQYRSPAKYDSSQGKKDEVSHHNVHNNEKLMMNNQHRPLPTSRSRRDRRKIILPEDRSADASRSSRVVKNPQMHSGKLGDELSESVPSATALLSQKASHVATRGGRDAKKNRMISPDQTANQGAVRRGHQRQSSERGRQTPLSDREMIDERLHSISSEYHEGRDSPSQPKDSYPESRDTSSDIRDHPESKMYDKKRTNAIQYDNGDEALVSSSYKQEQTKKVIAKSSLRRRTEKHLVEEEYVLRGNDENKHTSETSSQVKRVTIAATESKGREKPRSPSYVASTCKRHVQSLIEGGIFSENSHQVKDLLTIITDHDRLRVENNKKNDETNRMSEIIVQQQNQVKDALDEIKSLRENSVEDQLQKQIDAMKSENEALQKKHDESLRIANNTIACLEKALNSHLENKKEGTQSESNLKDAIELLRKNNKTLQSDYEEKLRDAESAITSLESALRAQVGLQKEEKKAAKEKSSRISKLDMKCKELEKELVQTKEQLLESDGKMHSDFEYNEVVEAKERAERRIYDLEEKLQDRIETINHLTDENSSLERQIKTLSEENSTMRIMHEEKIKSLGESMQTEAGTQELFSVQEQRIALLETNIRKLESINTQIGERSNKLYEENEDLKSRIKDMVWTKKTSIEKYESKLRSADETISSLQKALDSQMTLQNESNKGNNVSMEMQLLATNVTISQEEDESKFSKYFQEDNDPAKVNAIRKNLEETMRRNVSLGACVATLKSMLPEDDESVFKQYLIMAKKVDIQKSELEKALREALLREMRISQLVEQLKKSDEQLHEKFKIKTNLEAEAHSLKLNLEEVTSAKLRVVQECEKLKQQQEDMQLNKTSMNKEFSLLSKKLSEASKKASRVSELQLEVKKSEDKIAAMEREKSYVKQQISILQSKIDRETTLNDKRMKQQDENYNRVVRDLEQALEKKSALENSSSLLKERLYKAEAIVSRVPELEGKVNNYDDQCRTYKDKLNDLNNRVLELESIKHKHEAEISSMEEQAVSDVHSCRVLESQINDVVIYLDQMKKRFDVPASINDTNDDVAPDDFNEIISSLKLLRDTFDENISVQRKKNDELTKMFEDATEKMQNDLLETERRYRETDEELKVSCKEKETYKNEKEELLKKLEEQESIIKRMTRKLEEFKRAKREHDESATQIESMEMEISTLKRRLRDSEETVTKAEETRSSMKIQISILEESRQSSSETMKRQYETLTKLQEDFENSKSRERKLRLEVESLQSHLEGLESNIAQVVTARDAAEEESRGLRERLCEADVLAARVPGLENLINGYEEVVLSQKDDISSLQDEKLKLTESVDKLQNELLVYQTKFSEKQEEVSMVMKEIDIVITRKQDLETETESLRLELEDAKKAYTRIAELEDRIKDHEETIRTYEETIEDVKNESASILTAMKVKVSDMSSENKSVTADLNDRLKYIGKLKARLRKNEDTMMSQERMIDADNETFKNLQNKCSGLEEELGKTRNEKKKLDEEKLELEISLEQKNSDMEGKQNTLSITVEELNESQNRIVSMSEEISELTAALKRSKESLSHMSEVQSKLQEMEASLAHQQRVHNIDEENYASLVESMRTELLKASTEKNEVKTEFRTVRENLFEKDGAVKKLEYQLTDSKSKIQTFEKELKQKHKDLQEKQICIDDLQREVNQLTARVEKLVKQTVYSSTAPTANKIVEALQDEVVKLRKKLNNAEENAAASLHAEYSLRSELSKLESEHRETISHLRKEAKIAKNKNLMLERELKENLELLERAKRAIRARR